MRNQYYHSVQNNYVITMFSVHQNEAEYIIMWNLPLTIKQAVSYYYERLDLFWKLSDNVSEYAERALLNPCPNQYGQYSILPSLLYNYTPYALHVQTHHREISFIFFWDFFIAIKLCYRKNYSSLLILYILSEQFRTD